MDRHSSLWPEILALLCILILVHFCVTMYSTKLVVHS